jgi:hypothetical protein
VRFPAQTIEKTDLEIKQMLLEFTPSVHPNLKRVVFTPMILVGKLYLAMGPPGSFLESITSQYLFLL